MKTSTILSLLLQAPLFIQTAGATIRNDVEWRFESYLHATQKGISTSSANPGNGVFETPHSIYTSDNRLEFKWLINDAKVVARPQWSFTQAEIKNTLTKNRSISQGSLDLTDAFWEQIWSRRFSTTIGLQVYQWGPSEVFNASNPFFRFQKDQQTFAYKEKGKVLARANYTISPTQNFVIISEPISNNEAYWMTEKNFKPQSAIKYEYNPRNTRNYLGLVGGTEHQGNSFVGEYAQYELTQGLSIFLDAKHSNGYEYYYAKLNNSGAYDFVSTADEPKEWSSIVVGGFRYEGDIDFRIEGIHNSAGYDKENFESAVSSISNFFSASYLQNIHRFSNTGLNLLTKNYLYSSLRVTDPFSVTDMNLFLRTFNSLTDNSGLGQFEFDFSWGDYITWFGSYTSFYGRDNSEFTLTDRWRAQIGGRYML